MTSWILILTCLFFFAEFIAWSGFGVAIAIFNSIYFCSRSLNNRTLLFKFVRVERQIQYIMSIVYDILVFVEKISASIPRGYGGIGRRCGFKIR